MKKTALLVFTIVSICAALAMAQWDDPSGNYTGNHPMFCYYPVDGTNTDGSLIPAGSFTIRNAGANGLVDTPGNMIQGDDYGFIGIGISVGQDFGVDATLELPTFADGIFWSTFQFFNGQIFLSGSTSTNAGFLPVSANETILWSMGPGLDASAFTAASGNIEIESFYNLGPDFDFMPSGSIGSIGDPIAGGIFTVVGHVPEPSTFSLLGMALLAGLSWRRRF